MSRAIPMAPDDRRAHLLLAARSVFASLGYHRSNVSAIIAEAGVARGTFYNYFESKRACFQAVLCSMPTVSLSLQHNIAGGMTARLSVLVRFKWVSTG